MSRRHVRRSVERVQVEPATVDPDETAHLVLLTALPILRAAQAMCADMGLLADLLPPDPMAGLPADAT